MKRLTATYTRTGFIAAASAALLAIALLFFAGAYEAHAASVTASGRINSNDVNLRQSASTSSKVVGSLSKNTAVAISCEVFTGKTSASAKKRWYLVTCGSNTGYVRADLVDGISYGGVSASATDALNYRRGPATSFKKLGTFGKGTALTLLLPAKRKGSSESWYKVQSGSKTGYVNASYVSEGAAAAAAQAPAVNVDLTGKSALAASLLSNPTNGGGARVIATFDKNNCKKLFSVKGYKGNWVPQGMAFTGSEYYIVFGMSGGQSMVTYSATGSRLRASKFAFNMGHPNGITWNPLTGLCYIFRGNTKTIYTWNPATNQFGKSKTPYSSSGVAFDKETGVLYASSRTGLRVYSADGAFAHQKLFARCSHGGKHYIQDCGAQGGFIFHAVSGSNKHKTNWLDVYREADGSYLGSVKVNLGETESVVVGNDGYVQLLINHKGTHTEYIWKTPLNVNELK